MADEQTPTPDERLKPPGEATHGELVRRLSGEERDEVAGLYEKYLQRVIDEAKKNLRQRPRESGPGTSGVAHSVWESFLAKHLGEVDLHDEDSVWLWLWQATLRHCNKWNKRWQRHPTASLDAAAGDGTRPALQPADPRSGAAEQGATCADLLARLSARLTERQNRIVQLKLAGYTNAEIAAQIDRDKATVSRECQEIRAALEEISRPPAEDRP